MKINDIFVLTFNCKDLTLKYNSTPRRKQWLQYERKPV